VVGHDFDLYEFEVFVVAYLLDALVKDIVGESENSSDDFFQGFSSGFA
jgi:hypothetical protein